GAADAAGDVRACCVVTGAAAFTAETRQAVLDANLGRCAGCDRPAVEVHHRRPRGMGGTSRVELGAACNGVGLCRNHHRWAETHRVEARRIGWLLDVGDDPAVVPWWASVWGYVRWVLDDDTWLIELVQPRGARAGDNG